MDVLGAIKRPFTDFNKLGLGVILLILPIINIVTNFFVKGYKLEVARTAFKDKYTMPVWEGWGKLFLRGLLSWIIGLIFMIPAVILIAISAGKVIYNIILQYGLNQGLSVNNQLSDQLIQNALLQNTAMIPVFIVGVLLALLAAYLTPIAIMRYIEKYKFENAFKLKIIFKKAFKRKYFLVILTILIYTLIIGLIVSALNMGFAAINIQYVTIILGLIINGLSSFIVMVTSYTLIGEVYSKLK